MHKCIARNYTVFYPSPPFAVTPYLLAQRLTVCAPLQGAHPEASDVEVGSAGNEEKREALRVLNATVSAYTLEAGVILHRYAYDPLQCIMP